MEAQREREEEDIGGMSRSFVMLPPQSSETRSYAARLAGDVPGMSVLVPETEAELISAVRVSDAAYGTLPPSLIPEARGLRWLQCPQAGPPPGYYSDELVRHPVVVTNMRGTYTEEVATHAVTLLLALARGLSVYGYQQRQHQWRPGRGPSSQLLLSEATILIVGVGAVGAEVARRLAPFGSKIIGTDARLATAPEFLDELYPAGSLDDVLPRADGVVVTVPHTPATERLFARERFSAMKKGVLFVNVGRGPVVDIDDLVEAIHGGRVRSAALDVVPSEPLPAEHPLWEMPEVIITPHVASILTGESRRGEEARYRVLVENASRFVEGRPLLNIVDKSVWF